jgi:hypothetical protein
MEEKDRIDALIKLAEASWRSYSERRSIEWKVNFGLWAALGTFSGFMFQRETYLPCWIANVTSFILICIFIVYTFLWKTEIQKRNSRDKEDAHGYRMKVDNILNIESSIVLNAEDARTVVGGWRGTHLSQVIITFLFVLLAALAVWAPRWAG